MITEIIKSKIDKISKLSYDEIAQMIDQEPLTSVEKINGNEYQVEIIVSWDDKKFGTIRIAGYSDKGDKHWWQKFVSSSEYEVLVEK